MVQTQQYIKNWNWWYDSIIDSMLANPQATLTEIASELNVAPTWLSIIKNTDMFQERYQERRRMMSQSIDTAIKDKVSSVAIRALDITLQRLESEGVAKIPTKDIHEIADKSLARLGYGIQKGSQVVINNQPQTVMVGASKEALESARAHIRAEETAKIRENAIDGEIVEFSLDELLPELASPAGEEGR